MRNGVEPVVVNRPARTRRSRAEHSMSAPCATSCRTNSRLLMFPDPMGGGLPSPRIGLRTQVMACSAVKPAGRSFGLAPAFSRAAANSKWPFSTARIRGVAACRRVGRFAFSGRMVSFTSAPA